MAKKPLPRFEGEVDTRWAHHKGPDREMVLLRNFAFVDSRGTRWEAPKDRTIDGASIPEELWSSAVGTPYVGDYRRATVIHDVACQDKTRPHEEVHRMFYEAMLCDGVSRARALVMYTAVRLFGPRWKAGAAKKTARVARSFDVQELARALDGALGEETDW